MDNGEPRSCIDCGTKGCGGKGGRRPGFCLTDRVPDGMLEESLSHYGDGLEGRIMRVAATVEHDGYLRWCRVQETMEFAKRMGFRKIGIANCLGLLEEARTLAGFLRSNGFEVLGTSCKTGMVPKTDVGIDPECCEIGPNICNPVLQAEILNSHGTELNILVGLCVGHDSLFYMNSKAPVTTLVVKDRVLANNPAGALYAAGSFYKGLNGCIDRGDDAGKR